MKINHLRFALKELLIFYFVFASASKNDNTEYKSLNIQLSPVIFIPGLGGNKMQAKLNKSTVPHRWCSKQSDDYFDLWLNLFELMPNSIDCWADNMKLHYDNVTRKTENTPGVSIRIPPFGSTEDIEWIDTTPIIDHLDPGAYYYHIAVALTNRGYVRGENLFGAAYDFRKGPNENKDWFENLVRLSEYAYNANNSSAVTYIVHSMGGRMLLYFLQQMPQKWKDQYVKAAMTVSVPWGGSVQALVALAVGDTLDSKFLKKAKMKLVQEIFPAIVWLLPSEYFWKSNEVLANINEVNYTIENIAQFFNDIQMPTINEIKKDLINYNEFTAPGVEVHCLYGIDVNTVDRLNFGVKYNPQPILIKGNGDGVVNERSLIGCKYWKNASIQQNHKIYQQSFSKAKHISILNDNSLLNYILSKLTGYHDYPRANELYLNNIKPLKMHLL